MALSKVPLPAQVSAVQVLIKNAVYGTKFKRSEITFLQERWSAAVDTLLWLSQNEEKIKGALNAKPGDNSR